LPTAISFSDVRFISFAALSYESTLLIFYSYLHSFPAYPTSRTILSSR